MNKEINNSPGDGSKESLFADIKDLAMEENLDSGEFLKSISKLMESEKYEDVTMEIVGDEFIPVHTDDNEIETVENKKNDFFNPFEKQNEDGWENDEDWGIAEEDDDWGEEDNNEWLDSDDSWGNPQGTDDDWEDTDDDDGWGDPDESEDDEANSSGDEKPEDFVTLENDNAENVADETNSDSEKSEEPEIAVVSECDVGSENSGDEENQLSPEEIQKKKRNKIFYNIMMVVCLLICVYSVVEIGKYFYSSYKGKKEISNLKTTVMDGVDMQAPVIQQQVATDIKFPDEVVYASNSSDYKDEISNEWANAYSNLVELNSDCVGWLQIEDSNITYPVMYTPNDYDYYLYRDFEGDYISRGLPFMADGTLLNVSQNYLIYGHNMKDDTGFSDLTKYRNKEWLENHRYAYFYTAFGEGVYEVMDVVVTKVFNVDDECFKYYKYTGELTEDEFNTYVYYMDKMSSIDTGVEAVYGDQLLSLSTCYRVYDEEGRLVVVFKRVQ